MSTTADEERRNQGLVSTHQKNRPTHGQTFEDAPPVSHALCSLDFGGWQSIHSRDSPIRRFTVSKGRLATSPPSAKNTTATSGGQIARLRRTASRRRRLIRLRTTAGPDRRETTKANWGSFPSRGIRRDGSCLDQVTRNPRRRLRPESGLWRIWRMRSGLFNRDRCGKDRDKGTPSTSWRPARSTACALWPDGV